MRLSSGEVKFFLEVSGKAGEVGGGRCRQEPIGIHRSHSLLLHVASHPGFSVFDLFHGFCWFCCWLLFDAVRSEFMEWAGGGGAVGDGFTVKACAFEAEGFNGSPGACFAGPSLREEVFGTFRRGLVSGALAVVKVTEGSVHAWELASLVWSSSSLKRMELYSFRSSWSSKVMLRPAGLDPRRSALASSASVALMAALSSQVEALPLPLEPWAGWFLAFHPDKADCHLTIGLRPTFQPLDS